MTIPESVLKAVDRAGALADELGHRSEKVVDWNTSPKMHSVMLFRRLRTNLRAYVILWRARMFLEADIVLRCMVEATICLAANAVMGDEFVALVRNDAAATLVGAINVWREEGYAELVRGGEGNLRNVFGEGTAVRHARLDWQTLAERAGQKRLYSLHRMLSATSGHVTGLSLTRGVMGADGNGEKEARALDQISESVNFASMASTLMMACRIHADMIGAADLTPTLDSVEADLETASKGFQAQI
jgi:hypothetical protein